MTRLFGTDGVRGIANRDLTPELAFQLGYAGAAVLAATGDHRRPKILIGTDTRISCGMLEAALTAGICAAGADAVTCGVLPTPGVAHLTATGGYDAGVVISASHNAFPFNGIKFFDQNGFKLPDRTEDRIEALIRDASRPERPEGAAVGRRIRLADAGLRYRDHLLANIPLDLTGLRVALDCANGAAAAIAPDLFRMLGAHVDAIGTDPDGCNINDGCGSTHLDPLGLLTKETNADIGIAFDGDADRMLAVDGNGVAVDGDVILAIIAEDMHRRGELANDTLVVTIMSNLGLHIAAKERGIRLVQTQVGDRYVLEAMVASGHALGGEQSGHVILLEHATTGDGLLSSLRLLQALQNGGTTLAEARSIMTVLPQVLRNARVPNERKQEAMDDPDIAALCARSEAALLGRGRILIRPSGTEPIVRVMMEGADINRITEMTEAITAEIEKKYG